MKSHQAVEYGKPLELIETATPEPQGSEVLVRVEACGVCHSDVHLWEGSFDLGGGNRLDVTRGRTLPFTFGHEIVGEVVALGPDAQGATPGERRVVYPWIGCGACATCSSGEEHLCPASQALGVGRAGGYADHVVVPDARYLFDAGDVPVGLAGTYACSGVTAYSALRKAESRATGRQLLIIGAGGVGMAGLAIAREIIDAEIWVADIDPQKLDAAREAGADHVVDTRDAEAVKSVMKGTGGGAAAAVDFVGAESSAAFGWNTLARGGKLVIVGLFGGSFSAPLPFFPIKSVTVQGSYVGSPGEMGELMELVRSGRIPPIPVETRPIADVTRTLEDLRAGRIVGRVAVRP
ncbi:MAG: alcohol dehydrogenase catalytic domain-containing protein [Deltaproteobacteria bacterium]|nr:alcohol dehydrogenase catalytic domain-containing protein [Deltaproteobacteria bacterium]MBW2447641.1 alcohol dehydrogenase catalytic domain-containing protein [Deltaproteobacteria bacterium]